MAKVTTYLNFAKDTEAAFTFYSSVFGTEIADVTRFGDIPPQDGQPPISDEVKNLLMHIAVPTIGDHVLHGTDAPESMGFNLKQGNNVYINLEPDTREDTDDLFKKLSEGGEVEMPLADQFWGAYFGSLTDKFGTRWMFNCPIA